MMTPQNTPEGLGIEGAERRLQTGAEEALRAKWDTCNLSHTERESGDDQNC